MKRVLLILFVATFSHSLIGQISFGVHPTTGLSLAGTKNLLPSTLVSGAAINMALGPRRTMFSFGAGLFLMQNDNKYLKSQNARYLSMGFTYSPIASLPNFLVGANGLTSRITLIPDANSYKDDLFPQPRSVWNQWGYQVVSYYYFKKWFGVTISYSRYCARTFDRDNFQSILNAGVSFRGLIEKHGEEEKKD